MEEFYGFNYYRFARPMGLREICSRIGLKSIFELRSEPDQRPYKKALEEMRKDHLSEGAKEKDILKFIDRTPEVVCYFDETGILMT